MCVWDAQGRLFSLARGTGCSSTRNDATVPAWIHQNVAVVAPTSLYTLGFKKREKIPNSWEFGTSPPAKSASKAWQCEPCGWWRHCGDTGRISWNPNKSRKALAVLLHSASRPEQFQDSGFLLVSCFSLCESRRFAEWGQHARSVSMCFSWIWRKHQDIPYCSSIRFGNRPTCIALFRKKETPGNQVFGRHVVSGVTGLVAAPIHGFRNKGGEPQEDWRQDPGKNKKNKKQMAWCVNYIELSCGKALG